MKQKIGLLFSAEIDEWTGYRYYQVEQTQQVDRILYLKRLGLTFEEIKSLFDAGQSLPSFTVLKAKLQQCREKQKQYTHRNKEITNLMKTLQK